MNGASFNKFANSFQAIARLGLESIECLLNHLDNPQKDLKFVHIAGTNGKGSVCSFLQNIFTAAGFRTGKYTSPNLISVCERISLDGENISQNALEDILKIVENAAHLTKRDLGVFPTQFEIWTAAAFLYFKQSACDIVILETGLGGTRDATNIIPPPLASVITRIDLDHTEYLGDTIQKVAFEKAGIIKEHTDNTEGLCISAPQTQEALDVLKSVCQQKNNRFVVANTPKLKCFEDFHEIIDYTSSSGKTITDITCGISGFYQTENAALAAEVALALGISPEFIKIGIKNASNPARFEIIQKNPIVIYDGAHNKNGMAALTHSLKRYFPQWNGATFITAFMGDKDIVGTFETLKESGLLENSRIFTVKVKDNPRAASPDTVSAVANSLGIKATPFDELSEAYDAALKLDSSTILCGSLYLYKDFAEVLGKGLLK